MNHPIPYAAPREGLHLKGYLETHGSEIALMLVIASIVTIGNWRHWFYPDDMMAADGKHIHPLAGKLNWKRLLGDFLFIPTIAILGMVLVLGFSLPMAFAVAVVMFVAFVGSSFIMTTFERARDGALGVFLQFLTSWLPKPGGK